MAHRRLFSYPRLLCAVLAAGVLSTPTYVHAAAKVTIVNGDGANEGFNDPTPATPVGGNPRTTLGQQRLIAFQYAADLWGATLDSNFEIFVLATIDPLGANVLGSAGTTFVFANFPSIGSFPGPAFPQTWYHSALADKRSGVEQNAALPTSGRASAVSSTSTLGWTTTMAP